MDIFKCRFKRSDEVQPCGFTSLREHIFELGGFEGWTWPYKGVVTHVYAGAPMKSIKRSRHAHAS